MSSFFVDRDLGPRVGRALREVGVDVTLHRDLFDSRAADLEWIPDITGRGMIILTCDGHIRTRPAERAVFEGCGARCFVVAANKLDALARLRCLLIAWPEILERSLSPDPFMFGVGRDGRLTQYIPTSGPDGPDARRASLQARRRRGASRG